MRLICLLFPTILALPVAAQHSPSTKTKAAAAPASANAKVVTPAPAPLPPSPQKLDLHYGFRGVGLEADSAAVQGLSYDRHDNGLTYCHRDTDSLSWAGAAVDAPKYAFYRGKLLTLSFSTKGAANSHAVLARLQALYGPGEQKGNGQLRFTWRGEKALLRYEESSTNNNAVITLTSLPLTIKRQQDVSGVIEQTAANH
ncbi:hypothetical protein [Hymenobacter jeollabukensis]|uniref:Uncharacterized protein n=1 Tax=Hymenobacter jeollabukensis TaxID=2025313 RepID=A0A5R8WK85_9BACT|nr:hypothetical protein [Hymenobacter jeollabukensis]TLM89142.1 hypothetical protein FDY95_21465 [Hymenobacter jeollabukensis]